MLLTEERKKQRSLSYHICNGEHVTERNLLYQKYERIFLRT